MRHTMSTVDTSTLSRAACTGGSDSSAPAAASAAVQSRGAGEKPLGYQIKRLDQLIESVFERLLAEVPMSRRQWQALNVIEREPCDELRLAEALRPFWDANHERVTDVVAELTARAWLEREPEGRYMLTPEGRRVRASAAERVGRVRSIVAEGISEPEFAHMVAVLSQMIANLEKATAAPGR